MVTNILRDFITSSIFSIMCNVIPILTISGLWWLLSAGVGSFLVKHLATLTMRLLILVTFMTCCYWSLKINESKTDVCTLRAFTTKAAFRGIHCPKLKIFWKCIVFISMKTSIFAIVVFEEELHSIFFISSMRILKTIKDRSKVK